MPRGHYPRAPKQAVADQAPPVFAAASTDPLQKGRRVEDMGEAELRSYALQIGIYPRDAAELGVERLRQNVLLRLYDLIDE